jgi:hypothetical protein
MRPPDKYFYYFRSSAGPVVKVLRGDNPAQIVGGEGGWNMISRPRRTSLTQWGGREPYQMDVPVLFDGWRLQESVEIQIRRLQSMSVGSDFNPPPTIKIDGALPIGGATWVISSIDWGTEVFWAQNPRGQFYRMRQDAVVHLLQYEAEQRLKITITNSLPNQYIVQKGQTISLKTIAQAMYGNPSRWKDIQAANPSIRDPNKVIGLKTIRIP